MSDQILTDDVESLENHIRIATVSVRCIPVDSVHTPVGKVNSTVETIRHFYPRCFSSRRFV